MNKKIDNIRNKKGFTLIELLIVVAIIGILAAIAIPGYMDFSIKAKVSGIDQNIGAIKDALTVFYAEEGRFPDTAVVAGETTGTIAQINTTVGTGIASQYGEAYAVTTNTGVVTVTVAGIDSAVSTMTIIATPTVASNVITWAFTGTVPAKYSSLL